MPSHRPIPFLLAACLIAAGLSHTARGAGDSILIYGPESAGSAELTQAALLLTSTVEEGDIPDASIHVLDLPFSSADPVWIAGDSRVVPCTDPALESEDIPGLVAQAVDHIDALDSGGATRPP